jgi:glutaredoxin
MSHRIDFLMTFIVYSKENCPHCQKIKQVFDLTEQKYVVYTLGVDFTPEDFYGKFGEGKTFPQVTTNEQNIGGCSETIKYFREQKIL